MPRGASQRPRTSRRRSAAKDPCSLLDDLRKKCGFSLRVIAVGRPIRDVRLRLVSPRCPLCSVAPCKKLEARARAAGLDQLVLLVRLPRVLTLSGGQKVNLLSAGGKGPCMLAAHSEQKDLCNISKVKSHTPAVRTSIFADLVPDYVALVLKSPRLHNLKPFGQKGIGNPEVKVTDGRSSMDNRECLNLAERHRVVPGKSAVLWSYLASTVLKLPRRVR